MAEPLYPLRFKPIFKTALWGGHALRPMLGAAPSPELTGEAWLLSDQGDDLSRMAEGPLAGLTLGDLMQERPRELIGNAPASNGRFPLLLKNIFEARSSIYRCKCIPTTSGLGAWSRADRGLGRAQDRGLGHPGKRRVAVASTPACVLVSAGLRVERRRGQRHARGELLHSFSPRPAECIYLEAGTVHAIGAGVTLFEVQQTSDIDEPAFDALGPSRCPGPGRPRELHLAKALDCIDFERGPCAPVMPAPLPGSRGERLVAGRYFTMDRLIAEQLASPLASKGNSGSWCASRAVALFFTRRMITR